MPRQARVKSATGIYHIMIRGINKEKIFMSSIVKMTITCILIQKKKSKIILKI
ncbi:hypothetical protein JYG23_13335 [Sedimentibacter sp. zth1]|uniref:hypothetical protein n=1 Tax=Sedimentibacter sp. zth1 TaxID=2816908 RepID=UPI001A922836|nr:hypothetical protein [Sedimentibacter sp. zth1]QSX07412.1 hypothetical protein JYG23_13335 [Sedimentibacter sp. zth1]